MNHATPQTKQALITGASSGIGAATAIAFAKAGINLTLVARNQAKLDAVADQATQLGVEARTYTVDLAEIEQVKSRIEAIAAKHQIQILINNAGMGYTNPLSQTPLADWQQIINLNLTSGFQTILGVLPTMRSLGGGTIINVASVAAKTAFADWGAYSASKAGLLSLSQTLALEEQAHGIRVVCICPGAVDTALWDTDTVNLELPKESMLSADAVAQTILHAVSLPDSAVVRDLTIMPGAGALERGNS
jgi:short-subunit dehydrogenase